MEMRLETILTVREYVDGLVVEVEEAAHTAGPALQRAVAGEHVGVELQVARHVPPVQQPHRAVLRARLIITDMIHRLFPLLRPLPAYLLN